MHLSTVSKPWPPENTEMGRLIKEKDWSTTSLGPIEGWPLALRIAVTTAVDLPTPTCVRWGLDHIQIYNDAYRQVLGRRHPLALGQNADQCWSESWDFKGAIHRQVMATGESAHFEDLEFVTSSNGVPESRYFSITYCPIRDEYGTVFGVTGFAIDTTQRVLTLQANSELLKTTISSWDQLQNIFDQAPSFMALLAGPDYQFVAANPAYLRLIEQQDILGQTVRAVLPEAVDHGFLDLLDGVYATGMPYFSSEMLFVFRDNINSIERQRYLTFVYHPIKNKIGAVASIFVVGVDVTENRAARLGLANLNEELAKKVAQLESIEKRLSEINQCKDEFLATLAHELRNPLSALGATAQMLSSSNMDSNHITKYTQMMYRQVGHMNRLVEDLIDVSRVTQGLIALEKQTVDINEVVANAYDQVFPYLRSKNHRYHCRLPSQPAYVLGDPIRLVQVLVNLLSNAVKYTPENGKIDLHVEIDESLVTITLTDNGIGMSAELLATGFKLFSQAHRTSQRHSGGLGLGLALVKSLVDLHDGNVMAESAGRNLGSTFRVCLPRDAPVESSIRGQAFTHFGNVATQPEGPH